MRATQVEEKGAVLMGQRPTNFGAQQPGEKILVRVGRRQTRQTHTQECDALTLWLRWLRCARAAYGTCVKTSDRQVGENVASMMIAVVNSLG